MATKVKLVLLRHFPSFIIIMLVIFVRLSKVNISIKIISIEHVIIRQNFFLNYFTITCKRLIKVLVYQIVANLIFYRNKH